MRGMSTNPITHEEAVVKLAALLKRAVPHLQEAGDAFEDDGGNEPLELAREVEAALEAITTAASAQAVSVPEPLRDFARWALTESSFSGMDLDGGSVQDKAMELGLLVRREATKPCGDNCSCADFGFPSWCYRFAPLLEKAPAKEGIADG